MHGRTFSLFTSVIFFAGSWLEMHIGSVSYGLPTFPEFSWYFLSYQAFFFSKCPRTQELVELSSGNLSYAFTFIVIMFLRKLSLIGFISLLRLGWWSCREIKPSCGHRSLLNELVAGIDHLPTWKWSKFEPSGGFFFVNHVLDLYSSTKHSFARWLMIWWNLQWHHYFVISFSLSLLLSMHHKHFWYGFNLDDVKFDHCWISLVALSQPSAIDLLILPSCTSQHVLEEWFIGIFPLACLRLGLIRFKLFLDFP